MYFPKTKLGGWLGVISQISEPECSCECLKISIINLELSGGDHFQHLIYHIFGITVLDLEVLRLSAGILQHDGKFG